MQTLAHGATLSQKYPSLGGYTGRNVIHPSKITALFAGLPGDGKSNLLQSNPNAFIFNLDVSSTTTSDPLAIMFPGINPQSGRLIGPDGKDTILTMDLVNGRLDVLRDLAQTNKPRPETIVFDSLSSWITLLMQWIPRNAKKLGLMQDDVPEWRYLDGRAAWDVLYSTIINTITSLRNMGYGVHVVGHIVNAKIPLNENQFAFRHELTITDGFWKRLYPIFELTCLIYSDNVVELIPTEVKETVRGVETVSVRKIQKTSRKVFLTITKNNMDGLLKSRVKLPEKIELPESGAWAVFEQAYVQASK